VRGERQLLWLGDYLIRRASRQLPPDAREERYREWAAELPAILHDPQVRFAPLRAFGMLAYAADTLRGAARASGRLGLGILRTRAFERVFLVVFLVGMGASIWSIAQAPGNGQYYLQLTWSLLFVAYFVGRLAHVSDRITWPLMFGSAVTLEVLSIWNMVQAPRGWVNYADAAVLGLVLFAALLVGIWVGWLREFLARTRKA
jgi:hypothetical protein